MFRDFDASDTERWCSILHWFDSLDKGKLSHVSNSETKNPNINYCFRHLWFRVINGHQRLNQLLTSFIKPTKPRKFKTMRRIFSNYVCFSKSLNFIGLMFFIFQKNGKFPFNLLTYVLTIMLNFDKFWITTCLWNGTSTAIPILVLTSFHNILFLVCMFCHFQAPCQSLHPEFLE